MKELVNRAEELHCTEALLGHTEEELHRTEEVLHHTREFLSRMT